MGKLIYSMIMSVDGYIADKDGNFEWAAPDDEVHAFVNETMRSAQTHIYGRRMYEVLLAWETWPVENEPQPIKDYAALWRAADKIVVSRTLESAGSARTRIEREFVPEAIRELKASSDQDIAIAGPTLAASAIRAGLVDEYRFFVVPHLVGGGLAALPDDVRLELSLVDERRFSNGTVYLAYRTSASHP